MRRTMLQAGSNFSSSQQQAAIALFCPLGGPAALAHTSQVSLTQLTHAFDGSCLRTCDEFDAGSQLAGMLLKMIHCSFAMLPILGHLVVWAAVMLHKMFRPATVLQAS